MSNKPGPGRDYVTAGYLTQEKTPLSIKNPAFSKKDAVKLVTELTHYLSRQGCTYYGVTCAYRVPEEKWKFCAWYTMPEITEAEAMAIRAKLLKYSAVPAKYDGLVVQGRFDPHSFYSAGITGTQWRYVTKVSVYGAMAFVKRENDEKDVNEMFDLSLVDSARSDMGRPGYTLGTMLDVLKYPKERK
ncbi:uncharacterized protein APUU_21625S [Aspergillus puulaauensis]|uniref:Uncharacterized protein n=1 Tax=Aspergillus puulaauensis TaxID=1220207 RepID=A0A7R7XHE4_9EURO|nr:uncharacterized protein APUU_21625S [Aspergillus puulaauensis]BCS21193.1 hypothetical protein APUU_21625S [Aspergillus puulaauensis]